MKCIRYFTLFHPTHTFLCQSHSALHAFQVTLYTLNHSVSTSSDKPEAPSSLASYQQTFISQLSHSTLNEPLSTLYVTFAEEKYCWDWPSLLFNCRASEEQRQIAEATSHTATSNKSLLLLHHSSINFISQLFWTIRTTIQIFEGKIDRRSTDENSGEDCVFCPAKILVLPVIGQEKIFSFVVPYRTSASSCSVLVSTTNTNRFQKNISSNTKSTIHSVFQAPIRSYLYLDLPKTVLFFSVWETRWTGQVKFTYKKRKRVDIVRTDPKLID